MVSQRLLDQIPAHVRYVRRPMLDEENALHPWREAIARYIDHGDETSLLARGLSSDCESIGLLQGDNLRRVQEFLTSNRESLDLIDEGLRRGQLQVSQPYGNETCEADRQIEAIDSILWRLQLARVNALAAEGHLTAAAEGVQGILSSAKMLCNAEGLRTLWMIGTIVHTTGLDAAMWLSAHADATEELWRVLLQTVEDGEISFASLAQSERVDFCCYELELLEQSPDFSDLEAGVDWAIATFYRNGPILPLDPPPDDGRLAWRRDCILFLLRGHPQPFDREATARWLGEGLLEQLDRDRPWSGPRGTRLQSFIESLRRCYGLSPDPPWNAWPVQLTPSFPYEWLGPTASVNLETDPVGAECFERYRDWKVPSQRDLEHARRRIARLPNILGYLLFRLNTSASRDLLFMQRARQQGTRAILALRLYQRKYGRLSDDLRDLVDVGILKDIPRDPYLDAPLSYSRQRQVIWSVGPFDKGKGYPDRPTEIGPELFWHVGDRT